MQKNESKRPSSSSPSSPASHASIFAPFQQTQLPRSRTQLQHPNLAFLISWDLRLDEKSWECVNNPIPPKKMSQPPEKSTPLPPPNWKSPTLSPHLVCSVPSVASSDVSRGCVHDSPRHPRNPSEPSREIPAPRSSLGHCLWGGFPQLGAGSIPRVKPPPFYRKDANLETQEPMEMVSKKNDEMKKIESCQRKVSSIYWKWLVPHWKDLDKVSFFRKVNQEWQQKTQHIWRKPEVVTRARTCHWSF